MAQKPPFIITRRGEALRFQLLVLLVNFKPLLNMHFHAAFFLLASHAIAVNGKHSTLPSNVPQSCKSTG